MVFKEVFGKLPDGREVHRFTITNRYGESARLLDFGATIHGVSVLDRNSQLGDVVLGAPSDAIAECTYMGSIIGRYSGRVPGGKCVIDGVAHQLEQNLGEDFCHGASGNYARKLFSGQCIGDDSVTFTLLDQGEGGFGNDMTVTVTYTFGDDHCLRLAIRMTAQETTIVGPTNHAYFNLSGQDARDLTLQINTSYCTGKTPSGAADGSVKSVTGTPEDFTFARTLRQAMDSNLGFFHQQPAGYDTYYIFDRSGLQMNAELSCAENGRRLQVWSDAPGMVLYTPAGRAPERGKDGVTYGGGYTGVCLQPGNIPNATNCPAYASPLCRKGETYALNIHYAFGVTEKCSD